MSQLKVTAFAPASVANVSVGFDILGFSIAGAGDEVTVSAHPDPAQVEITEISGVVTSLPKDASKNTASVALQAMIKHLKLSHGFSLQIKKGIAMGSGMGGSAASAVAAVVAANAFLIRSASRKSFTQEELLHFALLGEQAASGSIHGDNVGPCLSGGLTLLLPTQPMSIVPIPVPADVFCVLVHPEIKIETRAARGILTKELKTSQWIEQSAWLAGFIAGCFQNDLEMIRTCMNDIVIEPQRAQLIPGFSEMKNAAHEAGAIGFGISGSGPSVFAWVKGEADAKCIAKLFQESFSTHGILSEAWVSPLLAQGAHILEPA